jgi:prephenate dehydratase
MNKIFVLGPAGTNGHEAAIKFSDLALPNAELIFCERNVEILQRAEEEGAYGVVPVENTTAGLVSEVVRDFWLTKKNPCNIQAIGEMQLPIEHHLLVNDSVQNVKEISSIISHPQALSQCARRMKELGLLNIPTSSTAEAARKISAEDNVNKCGAIASAFAAKIYRLKIILRNIEDFSENATRFHLVGPHSVLPSGRDRTAIIFKLPNKPCALFNALGTIAEEKINMSSIHSIPSGHPGEYSFYCEFDCHKDDSKGKKILKHMDSLTDKLLVLGSYQQNILC